jgi:hypothetical protein
MTDWWSRRRAELTDRVRDPVAWSTLIQLVKTAGAGVGAWLIAARVFDLQQAFLAPWAALLVVHATVYRTFSRGLQQVLGTVGGVLLAWLVGNLIGEDAVAVGLVLLVGLLMGTSRLLAEETTAVAATGLIVLTTGFSTKDVMLVERLLDTAIGIAVGLVVNFVVWPPLRDLTATRAIDAVDDEIGSLLVEIAGGVGPEGTVEMVEGWVERSRDIDEQIDEAWALLRQARESSRLNPRRAAKGLRTSDLYERVLHDDEQAVAEIRSIARTLGHSTEQVREWDPWFRVHWRTLLREAGEAIMRPDPDRVRQVRTELARMTEELSNSDLPGRYWAEYGALLVSLRNVVTSMDRVVEANPLIVPRYAARRRRLLRG